MPRCRFFYQFLLANERTVAKEIRDEYVDTMSKIYYSYFKSYSSRLLKVQVSVPEACMRCLRDEVISCRSAESRQTWTNVVCAFQYEEVADKDDLMGVEDTAKKGILPAGPAGGGEVGSDSRSGDDVRRDVVHSLTVVLGRLLFQTLPEEQEHDLYSGPAGGDPEPHRAGRAHPGPSHRPARRQPGNSAASWSVETRRDGV